MYPNIVGEMDATILSKTSGDLANSLMRNSSSGVIVISSYSCSSYSTEFTSSVRSNSVDLVWAPF